MLKNLDGSTALPAQGSQALRPGIGVRPPRITVMDVGMGMLATASELRRLRPDADLVLATDPDGMPWGVRTPEDLTARALLVASSAAAEQPDLLIVACNTATLHALPAIQESLGPEMPVLGTLPAVQPAAAAGGAFAVWGTPTGVRSPQLDELLRRSAPDVPVARVACHGLSDAIERADPEAVAAAIAAAADRTPADVRSVVLACTHYELVTPQIQTALQRGSRTAPTLYGSAETLAVQALTRLGLQPRLAAPVTGCLTVLRSGRVESLPEAARAYPHAERLQAPRAATRPVGRQ
nr:aspartate/glutamate racemase family protein [Streptacidiphilus jeojiense]